MFSFYVQMVNEFIQLQTLRSSLQSSHRELENLRVQETFFDPSFPPALGYVEEVNEKDLRVRHNRYGIYEGQH